jgi:Phosphotransferase enzyme family
MNEAQIVGLEHFIPRLHHAHSHIAALGLKECPVHGDAHPMNALVNSQGVLWFDWREASIAHPFTDCGWFLAWTFLPKTRELELPRTPSIARRLWTKYLKSFGLRNEIALTDVMMIALIARVLSYHEHFYTWQSSVPDFKPQYVNYFLRLLLRCQDV